MQRLAISAAFSLGINLAFRGFKCARELSIY